MKPARMVARLGAAVIFSLSGFAVTGTAQAGVAQCYDARGVKIGPNYDTNHPNNNFLQWVQRCGGRCARYGNVFRGSNNVPYPRAFTRGGGLPTAPCRVAARPAPPPGPPPAPGFNPGRARALMARAFGQVGVVNPRIVGLPRTANINGRPWRLARVSFDGTSYLAAVRRSQRRGYIMRVAMGPGLWSRPRRLGY